MMERTDRHYRYFLRRITRATLLYTEMVTTGAILHGDRERLLGFHPEEHPLSLQLGGDNPDALARCVEIAQAFGYDEYNLNVGCPSERVQSGAFGACLMAKPAHVARLVRAMKSATNKPVTVKHRIGIDGRESYEEMLDFVDTVNEAAPDRFIVHARIAVLGGLSPKENRSIPPLRYEDVYRLKADRPSLHIEINGHVETPEEIRRHLGSVDAVMVGRAAYETPYMFADVDRLFFGRDSTVPSRQEIAEMMVPYIARWHERGFHARGVFRHMLGLFSGEPGARHFRRTLSGKLPDELNLEALMREALSRTVRHRSLTLAELV